MFAEHEIIRGDTNIFGFHDFVSFAIGQNTVLVNTRLMSEGIFPDDGFIARHGIARDGRKKFRRRVNPRGFDTRADVKEILARTQRHDDFFERAITCPFANAVKRAFNLPRAAANGGKRVRNRQS